MCVNTPVAVIFDLGGVLVDYDFRRSFIATAHLTGLTPDEVRTRLFGNGGDFANYDGGRPIVDFECGRLSAPEFHVLTQKALQCSFSFDVFCDLWNCIFTNEIQPTVDAARALRARGLKVGVLSNTNPIHFEFLRGRMPLLTELEHVFASHELGCRKPDPEIFARVLARMAVAPARTVFVDDLVENIRAAQAAGLQVIHATDADAVQRGLRDLKLG